MTSPVTLIATEALNVEKLRMTTVAANLANEHTIITPNQSYEAKQIDITTNSFEATLKSGKPYQQYSTQSENLSPIDVYQPEHPLADKTGMIRYPGIHHVDEMATLLSAERQSLALLKLIQMDYRLENSMLHMGEEK